MVHYQSLDSLRQYEIDVPEYELSINLYDACCYLVDNRCSIRTCAKNMGYSKSTLHRQIHTKLRGQSYELYRCVLKQLKLNKHNTRRK